MYLLYLFNTGLSHLKDRENDDKIDWKVKAGCAICIYVFNVPIITFNKVSSKQVNRSLDSRGELEGAKPCGPAQEIRVSGKSFAAFSTSNLRTIRQSSCNTGSRSSSSNRNLHSRENRILRIHRIQGIRSIHSRRSWRLSDPCYHRHQLEEVQLHWCSPDPRSRGCSGEPPSHTQQ